MREKNLKTGFMLIVLGELLYFANTFFSSPIESSVGEFFSGVLLGLSIAINLIGIVLVSIYIFKNKK